MTSSSSSVAHRYLTPRGKTTSSSLHWSSEKLFITVAFVILSTASSISRPPTFTRLPSNGRTEYIYDNRESIELECKAEGSPLPDYRWTKDGVTIVGTFRRDLPTDLRLSLETGNDRQAGNLKIEAPKETDQGYYQCYAENYSGTAVSQVIHLKQAYLRQMPNVTIARVHSVGLKSHVMLTCNPPESLPQAVIFWTRGGEDTFGSMHPTKGIAQDLEGNLHFLSVQPEDDNEGKPYICNAYNPTTRNIWQGDDQIIKIKENDISGNSGPELVWGSRSNTTAMKGETLRLECIFAGTPVPDVEWRKSVGNPLPKLRTRYEAHNRELVIANVDFSDRGIYECSASNGIGPPKTREISVQVGSKPYFTTRPINADLAEEESYSLICEANGNPPPVINILRNGEDMGANLARGPHRFLNFEKFGRRYVIQVGNLTITDLSKGEDTAVFQCNASNIYGYVVSNTYLNVLAEPPGFTEAPAKKLRVVEDSDAVWKCRTTGAPKPNIKWWHRGAPWSSWAQVLTGSRYEILENGDLKINSVRRSDQGTYTCTAENKFGGEARSGELEIQERTTNQMRMRMRLGRK